MNTEQAAAFLRRLDDSAERHESVAAGGVRIVWRRWGSGRPVVLLHGGAGCWMHWVHNIEALAAQRAVWVPDLPGFGDSDVPEGRVDADTIAPMVLAGTHELLQRQSFDLVGFSFGSVVAGHMAAHESACIDRLVGVGMSGLGLMAPHPELRSLRGVVDAAGREEVLRANLGVMMVHDRTRIDALALAVHASGVERERARGRRLVRTDVLVRLAPAWRCRAAAVWGAEDFVHGRDRVALDAVAQRIGLRRSVVLDGVGHWVQFEAAETVNALLREFLATD
jgi:2-hydroxy-6-oxonona-2,4-dienedioate hydrolase